MNYYLYLAKWCDEFISSGNNCFGTCFLHNMIHISYITRFLFMFMSLVVPFFIMRMILGEINECFLNPGLLLFFLFWWLNFLLDNTAIVHNLLPCGKLMFFWQPWESLILSFFFKYFTIYFISPSSRLTEQTGSHFGVKSLKGSAF